MRLASLSHSITNQFTGLRALNQRYENYFERVRYYGIRGEAENAIQFRDMARRERANIQNALNRINAEILQRHNLAMHGQNSFPAYSLGRFSIITESDLDILAISHTLLNSRQ